MNKLKRFTISLAALLLFSGVGMVAPALAHDGSSGDSNTTSSSNDSTEDNTSTTTEDQASNLLAEQFKMQGKLKNAADRLEAKEHHTEAEREKACTARKTALTHRMSGAVTQANKHKAVFDKIYTRVQDFYTTKKLNVSNYDSLKAQVDAAQSAAQTSIDALSALNVNVDCNSQTVADSVSAFQQAVRISRESLKAYRKSLVDLITALKGASTGAQSDNSTESTTNTTNQ